MGSIDEDGGAPKVSPNWGCRIWLTLTGLALLAICGGVAHWLWTA